MAHRYLFPIGIIAGIILALLSVASHLSLERSIEADETAAATINIAGRQRMLSQRIALVSLCLATAKNETEREGFRKELGKTLDLMEVSHRAIINGDASMGLTGNLSPELRAIYFNPPTLLDKEITAFIELARKLAATPAEELTTDNEELHLLISTASTKLLRNLDMVARQFQKEIEGDIDHLEDLNDWIMGISLAVLALMAAFIFTPMVRRIKRESGLLEEANELLEERVRERTEELSKSNKELQKEATERHKAEEEIKLFRNLVDRSSDAIFVIEPETGRFLDVNEKACQGLGYERAALLKLKISDIESFIPRNFTWEEQAAKVKEQGQLTIEGRHKRSDGTAFPVEVNVKHIHMEEKDYLLAVVRDITTRRQNERAIRESEERYRALFEQANDSIVLIDVYTGRIVDFNDMTCLTLGYSRDEFSKLKIADIEAIENPRETAARIDKIINHGSEIFDTKHKKKNGDIRDVLVSCRTVTIGGNIFIQGIWHDITDSKIAEEELKKAHDELEKRVKERTMDLSEEVAERRQAEKRAKKALEEKEILLQEIHHRVKNNMQVITSMLNLQSGYIKEPAAKEAFRESQDRIKSMALIHEKLYKSTDLASVDFAEYLKSLTAGLFSSYHVDDTNIRLKTEVDCTRLDIDMAIEFGLIINELVSNALKHAFTGMSKGEISVTLKCSDKDGCTLIVKDNGVGMPEGFDLKAADSLGLQLVDTLVEQAGGKISMETEGGTSFKLTFPASCKKNEGDKDEEL